jgi:hypothetical protein
LQRVSALADHPALPSRSRRRQRPIVPQSFLQSLIV